MANIDIGACLSGGVACIKRNPVFYLVGYFLLMVISNISAGILMGPLMVGFFRAMKKEEEGGKAEIGDLFKGFDDFVPALIAALLGGIAVFIGCMMCFVPGLLIMALVPCAVYLVAMGEKDGINALKRAWAVVVANLVMAAVAMLVLVLVSSVGVILCYVGIFLTGPIGLCGMYVLAKQMTAEAPVEAN